MLTAAQQQIRVRIAFIDAPEKGQAFGQRAKEAMSKLVFGKEVELRSHTIDRYGRTVALVFVDGQDAGLEMLKVGLAWVYEPCVGQAPLEIQEHYRQTVELAHEQRCGLWSDLDRAVPPWEWRRLRKRPLE